MDFKSLIYNIFLFMLLLNSACEAYLGGDINKHPNNPVNVPVSAQMPSIQISLADIYGGDFSRFNCMLIQQVEGAARSWRTCNFYTGLQPSEFEIVWSNVYEKVLNEIKIAKNSVMEDGHFHYLGVLKVMEAFTLMMATDVWDDIPYSDALKGIESMNPVYDDQSIIYDNIYRLLDESLALFEGPPGSLLPGNEDVFYGGNIELWKKAAYAIKARGLMKDEAYAQAIDAAKGAFFEPSENLGFHYPDANAAGQWYRFNRDRTGDMRFHGTMRNLMLVLNDTARLAMIGGEFNTNHPYLVPDFFQELITYREIQFIIAEADLRLNPGGTIEGYEAYLKGIKASFERLGLGEMAYNNYVKRAFIDPGVGNLRLVDIMTQKYIALYLQPESYSDWRRTNIPVIQPTNGDIIPVRWHYSAAEHLFNANAPAVVDIFNDKVGWDQ